MQDLHNIFYFSIGHTRSLNPLINAGVLVSVASNKQL
jgi:hypothetical protein